MTLRVLKVEPKDDVIRALESALEQARAGQLISCVILGDKSSEDSFYFDSAGQPDRGAIMIAFETWKFRAIASQELEKP